MIVSCWLQGSASWENTHGKQLCHVFISKHMLTADSAVTRCPLWRDSAWTVAAHRPMLSRQRLVVAKIAMARPVGDFQPALCSLCSLQSLHSVDLFLLVFETGRQR